MIDLADLRDPAFLSSFTALTKPGRWGCIEWVGRRRAGYGQVQCRGRTLVTSRVGWMLHRGELIADEMTVDHLCCNKPCLNGEHLETVTGEENSRRIFTGVPGWIEVGPSRLVRRRVRADEAWKYTASGRLRKVA